MITQPDRARFETGSLLQALLSLYGLGSSLFITAGLLIVTWISASSSGASGSRLAGYPQQFIALAWIALFLGLLCLPSLWFAVQRLRGKTSSLAVLTAFPRKEGGLPHKEGGFRAASAVLLIWPLLLIVGSLLSKSGGAGAYLLTPFTILATAIPLWWLVELARRGLGSAPQRSWGTLVFALFFTNPLTMLVEIILLLGLAVVAGLILSGNAYYVARLQTLSQEILQAGGDTARIQQIVLPLLSNPIVVFAGVSIISGLIPLVEELCKSLAVWVLLGRKLNPSEGLVIGAIAGAGFALTETLFSLSGPGMQGQWLTLVVGRTGTGLLHVTTAALVGLGLASFWQTGKFLRFLLAYLSAVTLHGLWNLFSISSGLATYLIQPPAAARAVSIASLAGMVGLGLVFFLILILANRRLRPAPNPVPVTEILTS